MASSVALETCFACDLRERGGEIVLAVHVIAYALTVLPQIMTAALLAQDPASRPFIIQDPAPRYSDPPAGRYRLPNGIIVHADPPKGFYDPPPGLYPVIRPGGNIEYFASRGVLLGPLPTAEASMPAWRIRRKRLRIAFGLSMGVLCAGLLAPLIGGLIDVNRADQGPKGLVGNPSGTMFLIIGAPIGLMAAVVTGILLGVHRGREPKANHRLLTSGGFGMKF